jgi:hypothetical protein
MSGISLYQVSRLSGQADRIPQLISVVAECLSYLALTSSSRMIRNPAGPGLARPRSSPRPAKILAARRPRTHPHVLEAVQARQHARTDGSQGIQGALYVPVSLRIAVQSSPAQMLLILPWLRR